MITSTNLMMAGAHLPKWMLLTKHCISVRLIAVCSRHVVPSIGLCCAVTMFFFCLFVFSPSTLLSVTSSIWHSARSRECSYFSLTVTKIYRSLYIHFRTSSLGIFVIRGITASTFQKTQSSLFQSFSVSHLPHYKQVWARGNVWQIEPYD